MCVRNELFTRFFRLEFFRPRHRVYRRFFVFIYPARLVRFPSSSDCRSNCFSCHARYSQTGSKIQCNVCFSEKERQRYAERMGDPIQPVLARPASNTTLLARYCKDKVPRTCDHAILQNTSRPCSLGESFVSSGSSLTIEMRMVESTALRQVF